MEPGIIPRPTIAFLEVYLIAFERIILEKPSTVKANEMACTVTSMNFFDKLKHEGIVRDNGNICKCFDEFYEGITISDELRKVAE